MQIIVFLIVFSVIVTIHEFGHFYFAKRAGVIVREFAIGMGPKLVAFRHNGTTFTIRMLPLGGYVRLAGYGDDVEPLRAGQLVSVVQDVDGLVTTISLNEKQQLLNAAPFEVAQADLEKDMFLMGRLAGQEEQTRLQVSKEAVLIEESGISVQVAPIERQFESASLLNRMLINFAGPLFNFILSIIVFTGLAFLFGGVASDSNTLGTIVDNSPASTIGLKSGDTLVKINDTTINNWADINQTLTAVAKEKSDKTVTLVVKHADEKEETYSVALADGKLGITPAEDTSIGAKLTYGFKRTWAIITNVFNLVATIFTGTFNVQQLGGPVAIAQISGQVAELGVVAVISFLAALSVNLGIMNLLPIPGLDGGKLLLNLIEAVRGKPLSREKETIVTLIGAALLVILMLVVTFNDIQRWLG